MRELIGDEIRRLCGYVEKKDVILAEIIAISNNPLSSFPYISGKTLREDEDTCLIVFVGSKVTVNQNLVPVEILIVAHDAARRRIGCKQIPCFKRSSDSAIVITVSYERTNSPGITVRFDPKNFLRASTCSVDPLIKFIKDNCRVAHGKRVNLTNLL